VLHCWERVRGNLFSSGGTESNNHAIFLASAGQLQTAANTSHIRD